MKLRAITFIFSVSALLGLFLAPQVTQADDYGLKTTADQAKLSKYGDNVPTLAGNIIGTALSMISVIFFILMVYGGFLWMTAHGDEGQVKKAQDTIIGAVIGIIVILASYAITNYVTTSVISSGPGGGGGGGGGGGAPPVVEEGGPSLDIQCMQDSQCGANQICNQNGECIDLAG